MDNLLESVLKAHGGLDRWTKFSKLTATIVSGGGLFQLKGIEEDLTPREITVILANEITYIAPFGKPDWHATFTPNRVAVESNTGELILEVNNPRNLFSGHVMATPWEAKHRAYFTGYTLWTYLTTPFLLAHPGIEVTEISPWQEGNESWRGLHVQFPDEIASHSKEQIFYFGEDFLLRRQDYAVDIAGGFWSAHYDSDMIEVDGFRFPTKRRVYLRAPNGKPIKEMLMVWIDLKDFRFTL